MENRTTYQITLTKLWSILISTMAVFQKQGYREMHDFDTKLSLNPNNASWHQVDVYEPLLFSHTQF